MPMPTAAPSIRNVHARLAPGFPASHSHRLSEHRTPKNADHRLSLHHFSEFHRDDVRASLTGPGATGAAEFTQETGVHGDPGT